VGGFRHGSQETTIHAVHAAMLIQDMIIVGDAHTTFHYGGRIWSGHPEGFEKDAFGLETVRNLGRRVASLASRLRDQGCFGKTVGYQLVSVHSARKPDPVEFAQSRASALASVFFGRFE
jgi:hypothetical protein